LDDEEVQMKNLTFGDVCIMLGALAALAVCLYSLLVLQ
jgi:hypothetical protein